MSNRGMFRMTEIQPFDAGLLGIQAIRFNNFNNRATGSRSSPFHAPFGSSYDEEKLGLLNEQPRRERISSASAIVVCAAVALWFLVIIIIFIMYWQFTSSVATIRNTAEPFVLEAVNHTMSILFHAEHSMLDVNSMSKGASAIASQAVPAMQLALNQTSAMIARLEVLARHPVLQLSIGQGQMGPAVG
jgi:hypothetical protein